MKRVVTILLILTFAIPLSKVTLAQEKSPVAAALMSAVLPGTGQLYTRQPGKGWLMAGTYLGTIGLVVAYGPWTWEEKRSSDDFFGDLSEGTSGTTKAIWYGSVGAAGLVWIWSVIDAPKAAKRINSGKYSFVPYYSNGLVGVKLSLKTAL